MESRLRESNKLLPAPSGVPMVKQRGLSLLGLLLLADQMLLPMFHPLGVPFKPTYLILIALPLGLAALGGHAFVRAGRRKLFWSLALPVAGIALAGCLGQIYLTTLGDVINPNEVVRRTAFYILMILALNFGQHVPDFQLGKILWLLYALVALILLLSVAAERVPLLARLWWGTDDMIAQRLSENEFRPLPFGDGSMVGANILFLFVVVSSRLRFLRLGAFHVLLSMTLVIATSFILGSRNQLAASVILAVALVSAGSRHRLRKFVFAIALMVGIAASLVLIEGSVRNRLSVVDHAYARYQHTEILNVTERARDETILRPLKSMELFYDRFRASPVIGSGFSILPFYPFEYINFHNDWFYVWATSGAVGGLLLFLWMFRIKRELGALALLPFFLPGLTNSFLAALPAVIVYCFMVGVLSERRRILKTL